MKMAPQPSIRRLALVLWTRTEYSLSANDPAPGTIRSSEWSANEKNIS